MMILPKNEISIEKLEKRVDTIENLYRTMAKEMDITNAELGMPFRINPKSTDCLLIAINNSPNILSCESCSSCQTNRNVMITSSELYF